jgi:hypothetical protein
MTAHAQDDAGPATGNDGRTDAERDDQRAVAGKGPTIARDVAATGTDGQGPEAEASDQPD